MKILHLIKKFLINKKLILFIFTIIISLSILYWIYFTKNNLIKEILKITDYNYNNCEKIQNTNIESYFINNSYKKEIKRKIQDCDNMYKNIELFSDIDFDINNKYYSPFLYSHNYINGDVIEYGIYDYDLKIDKNIDLNKSNFNLYFSNDNYELLENIIESFPINIDGTLEDMISLLYIKNIYLKNEKKIINSKINNQENDNEILEKIYNFQNNDSGFKKYILDSTSDLETTIFINEILNKLKDLGVKVNENIINSSNEYINNNLDLIKNNDLDYLKNKYVNGETSIIEKAKLLSKLIDTNYNDKERIDEILNKLNKADVSNYYFNNIEKLYLFDALIKYTNKYSKNMNKSKFGFMLGSIRNPEKTFWVGRVTPSFKRNFYEAKEVIYNNEAFFRVVNIEGNKMNFGLVYNEYLNDYSEKKISSELLNISREFFNISDENKLKKCIINNILLCPLAYSKKQDNVFEEGKNYKIQINILNKTSTGELIFEDYIPDNFVFVKIDDKYNTNNYKYISYDNNKLKVIFDNNKDINFTYFVKAKTKGVFDYLPSVIYSKNTPEIISSTNFYKVEVK